ncbi:MAG: cupin domain-containing protein [Micrococcales bacterium]|nr:cupin domain-containing protein [Micrococcales bacterium]
MDATGDVQIDTETLRVTKWTIPPGQAIPMHVHEHDYVVVPLVSATMHLTGPDGGETVSQIQQGRSYHRPAGAEHRVANHGESTIEFVEMEILRAL